jgi:ParB/RepB/Spo0J family partition protein
MDDTAIDDITTETTAAPAGRAKRCNARPAPEAREGLGSFCLKPKGHTGDHMGAREIPWSDVAPPAAEPADPGRYDPSLAIELIDPSEHNRKTMAKLEELAESIRSHGVINAILVRPLPGGRFGLVHGERRWRSAQLAGLATIPAMIRDLTEVQVLEIQLVENVQREDVHPLEEADGYQLLITKHGYTVDKIVEKTGKSKAWVYGRLKLCSLAKLPRQAFLDGKLQPSIALMIARIPTQKLQEAATRGVLGAGDYGDYEAAGVGRGTVDRQQEPLSTKAASAFIQRHFMLRLELAKFDITDRTLVPTAGACTDCTHRTGNQRELFADVATPDVCTNPPCHDNKTAASFQRAAAEAKERGVEVIAGKKAEGLFHEDHRGQQQLSHQAKDKYFDPKDELGHDVWTNYNKNPPTWSKALGKDLANVPRVLVQDGTGAARELLDKSAAVKLLKEKGALPKPGRETDSRAGEERKRLAAMKRRREVVYAGLRAVARKQAEVFVDGVGPKAATWWRWVASALATSLNVDDQVTVARAFALDLPKRSDALVEVHKAIATSGVVECRAWIVAMLGSTYAVGGSYGDYSKAFRDACNAFGVDTKKLAAEIDQAAAAAKKTAKIAAAAPSAKPSKKSGKKGGRK